MNWSVTSLESSSVSTHNSWILNITDVSFRHVLSGDRPIPGDQHPFPKIAYKTQGRDDVPERIGAAKRSSGDGDGHFYTPTSLNTLLSLLISRMSSSICSRYFLTHLAAIGHPARASRPCHMLAECFPAIIFLIYIPGFIYTEPKACGGHCAVW